MKLNQNMKTLLVLFLALCAIMNSKRSKKRSAIELSYKEKYDNLYRLFDGDADECNEYKTYLTQDFIFKFARDLKYGLKEDCHMSCNEQTKIDNSRYNKDEEGFERFIRALILSGKGRYKYFDHCQLNLADAKTHYRHSFEFQKQKIRELIVEAREIIEKAVSDNKNEGEQKDLLNHICYDMTLIIDQKFIDGVFGNNTLENSKKSLNDEIRNPDCELNCKSTYRDDFLEFLIEHQKINKDLSDKDLLIFFKQHTHKNNGSSLLKNCSLRNIKPNSNTSKLLKFRK